MASKRIYESQGDTPGKPKEKIKNINDGVPTSRKSLFGVKKQENLQPKPWSPEENAALVQYICLYWDDAHTNRWPTTKNPKFWEKCADAVNRSCKSSRTGTSCRSRVTKHLSKTYATLQEAEEALGIDYVFNSNPSRFQSPNEKGNYDDIEDPLSPMFQHCSPRTGQPKQKVGDIVAAFMAMMPCMTPRLKNQVITALFKKVIMDEGGFQFLKFVSSNFLPAAISAMKTLQELGKHNLILDLAKCFQKVENSVDRQTRMPTDRMPFGLIDFNIRFFSSSNTQMLRQEEHYTSWLETMFAQFGHKWISLFRGPAWQYDSESKHVLSDVMTSALELSGISLESEVSDNENHQETADIDQPPQSGMNDINQEPEIQQEIDTVLLPRMKNITFNRQTDVQVQFTESSAEPTSTPSHHISTIWTHVSSSQEDEIREGMASPQEIESYHCIRPVNDKSKPLPNPNLYDPLKSKVNVACVGVRQLQRKIQCHGFTRDVKIQMKALQEAQKSNPKGRWWLKADACDVREGIRESMRKLWAGDEDLGDGALQKLYNEYKARCHQVTLITSTNSLEKCQNLETVLIAVKKDLEFLLTGEREAKLAYQKALMASRTSQNTMMDLSWSCVGFEELVKQCKCLIEELTSLNSSSTSARGLQSLQQRLLKYLHDLYSKKRTAASHLLVFMIADELRNFKPYAIPVQFLTYKSITDDKVRNLVKELETTMTEMGMIVVGFCTDGEFNSLRTRGRKRAVSVIELIKNAKQRARNTTANVMATHFQLDEFGNILNHHPVIPIEDIRWVNAEVANGGCTYRDALLKLRKKLFPNDYEPHHWVAGREETTLEVQKSLFAIYTYRKSVDELRNSLDDPADFSKFLYQPERNDITSELFHDREDHNHLLKRIINCLREGLIPGINLRFLRDALHDPTTGLTYEALTGKNKQSVPDCERLISRGVLSFLERVGHGEGATILQTIHNWHKAVDGRGLSEDDRSKYIVEMKNWILDDWVPWHRENPDYSTIDVNRPIKGICGLTREVVVGLVANLESRELRREEYINRGLPPEHPRSSSTDDVEGLFALLHEILGPTFDLKQFYDELPKILNEFNKRIDPDLPFYYWTGNNTRYRDFAMPSFNIPSGPVERLDRVVLSRRGDPGVFVANRASLPERGKLTVRATYHRAPVGLPPAQV